MRIGDYELGRIRNKILDELYDKRENELTVRKKIIAKENRELYMEPLLYLLDQLPIELISHTDEYVVRIKYTPNADKTEILLDERWLYKASQPMMNPKKISTAHYQDVPESVLDPRLQEKADKLCKDILTLKTEKDTMRDYLVKTTNKYKGSLKLKEIWKDEPALYKHLPPEPIKVPKPKPEKKVSNPDLEVPTFLKDRMTINLLEDN